MKARFVVINEHRGGDVHGVDKAKAFSHATVMDEFFDLRRDIDEAASTRHFEPKMFRE